MALKFNYSLPFLGFIMGGGGGGAVQKYREQGNGEV
jgi:hypothetical protein